MSSVTHPSNPACTSLLMSRAPPVPTRRHSPSITNGVSYIPSSAPGTSTIRPSQISRPGSRPTTPVTSISPYPPPNTAPLGPSRPQRSEFRARTDYSESERASISSIDPYKDSASTSRSEWVICLFMAGHRLM